MSTLAPGVRLGPYLLLGPLGEGGMGKVYRARDVRLDREVALKVLKPPFSTDPEWLARFEREARLLASFSHPSIATVHGFDDADGVRYLALELVPGRSLAERLERGATSVAEAIDVARQISEALEAAHERGIIHRDLKPGNVMLTPDGKVKVLDFGLARLSAPDTSQANAMETRALDPVTVEGSFVGTPAYVSPEQARGLRLDRRCDLWALGCVLFEMLSGKKAFSGETLTDVLASVLHDEPNWDALPSDLPPRVAALVRRCLKKDVRRRLCDAGDARIELEEASSVTDAPPPPRPRRPWIAAALIALAFAGGIGLGIVAATRRTPAVVTDAATPEAAPEWVGEQLLDGTTVAFGPRVSPDGKWLAYGTLIDNQTQIGMMNLKSGDRFVRTTDKTHGMLNSLSWAKNSQSVYFDRFIDKPNGVFLAYPPDVHRPAAKTAAIPDAECPQVTYDRSILCCKPVGAGRSEFWLYSSESNTGTRILNEPVELTAGWPPASVRALNKSPGAVFCGKWYHDKDASPERFLYLLDLTGKQPPKKLYAEPFPTEMVALAVAPDDECVYTVLAAEDTFRLVRIPLSGPDAGKPKTLWLMTNQVFGLDVDADGRLYVVQFPRPREVLRFTPTDAQPTRLALLSRGREMEAVRLPDGRMVVPNRAEGRDRLLLRRTDGEMLPLLDDGSESRHPAALVAGKRLAFVGGEEKKPTLKLAELRDGGVGEVAAVRGVPADGLTALASSPDGDELYYVRKGVLWRVQSKGGEPRSLGPADGFAVHPRERRLLVQRFATSGVTLVWVALDGKKETPVKLNAGPLRLVPYVIGTQAIDDAGKTALVCVGSPDRWFWTPGTLNLSTGELTRLPMSYEGDVSPSNWARGKGGEILGVGYPLRSEMWRLTPRS